MRINPNPLLILTHKFINYAVKLFVKNSDKLGFLLVSIENQDLLEPKIDHLVEWAIIVLAGK